MINEFLLQLMNILWISEEDIDKELEKEIPEIVIKEIYEEKIDVESLINEIDDILERKD
jgi:hypothetical protein